jgi:hypothetical protein
MSSFSKPCIKASDPGVIRFAGHHQDHLFEQLYHSFDGTSNSPAATSTRENESKKPLPKRKRSTSVTKAACRSRARRPKSNQTAHQFSGQVLPPSEQNSQADNADPSSDAIYTPCETIYPTMPQDGSSDIEGKFGCISLIGRRQIQFCGFSDSFASRMGKEIVKGYWPKGIRKEGRWGTSYQIKLRGFPWGWYLLRMEAFMRGLFILMHKEGYEVHDSNNIQTALGTYYFKKSPHQPKGAEEWMSIAFQNPNRLRLIYPSKEFVIAATNLLKEKGAYHGEIKSFSGQKGLELKLYGGYAWKPYKLIWVLDFFGVPRKSLKVTGSRFLIMDLMKLLDDHGWRLYASSDMTEMEHDAWNPLARTWHCVREISNSMEPGMENVSQSEKHKSLLAAAANND